MPALTPEQIKHLPDNPHRAILRICELYFEFLELVGDGTDTEPKDFIEYIIVIKIYSKKAGLEFNVLSRSIPPDEHARSRVSTVMSEIRDEVSRRLHDDDVALIQEYYEAHLGEVVAFEVSVGDIEAINNKLHELRKLIGATPELDHGHKERILKRLEALQGEIHQKNSNFDKLTGSLLEVIMVAQRAGEAGQPWVNIAKDIFAIIWVAQGHVYQLASSVSAKLLN